MFAHRRDPSLPTISTAARRNEFTAKPKSPLSRRRRWVDLDTRIKTFRAGNDSGPQPAPGRVLITAQRASKTASSTPRSWTRSRLEGG